MGDYPDLEEVIDRLLDVTWEGGAADSDYQQQLLHVVQRVTVDEMMNQASSGDSLRRGASGTVRPARHASEPTGKAQKCQCTSDNCCSRYSALAATAG